GYEGGNLRVLEVASLIPGPYCGKLLASLGATVIKAEPPNAGDPSRRRGPFPNDIPHPERSGLYLYLNTGKQSITLNLQDPAGRDLLCQLVARVDMVVHDYTPANAALVGLDDSSLHAANPNVIIVPITPFGSSGPYADYRAGHLATFHAGGEGWLLPNGVALDTFPDRPPIVAGANMGDYQAGLTAAVGALAAVHHRLANPDTSTGQTVDASSQEAQLSVGYMPIQRHESEGITETRFSRYFRVGGVLPASDGYVELLTLEPRQFQGLLEFMGNPDWASPEMFSDPATHGPELNRYMREWFSQHTREWVYAEGQAHGVPVAPYYTPSEVFTSPQQRQRDFYTQVNHPETGPLEYTGAPFQLSETPTTQTRAPLLGEQNADVYCDLLGYKAQELAALVRAGAI
ncbi:MAG: CoA transferase, partial [Chloroflexi bacterium]|nr:CoA transferase [Chloroflexota bacterium]